MPIAAHLRSFAGRLPKILAVKDHDKELLMWGQYEPTATAREKQAVPMMEGKQWLQQPEQYDLKYSRCQRD